ncbi:MAG: hypothetical protein FJ368_04025 [Pelagibacterales bacterium]|nr:hypothetical protein [Pelagibacterales bacterium]
MASEGVNSAMLASMDSHGHSFSGKGIPQTGEGLGGTFGGDTLAVFHNEGLDGIFKMEEIGIPFSGDVFNARAVVGQSMGPFGISGTTIPPIDGSLKVSPSHLGFVEQTNAKLPKVASQGGQEH